MNDLALLGHQVGLFDCAESAVVGLGDRQAQEDVVMLAGLERLLGDRQCVCDPPKASASSAVR